MWLDNLKDLIKDYIKNFFDYVSMKLKRRYGDQGLLVPRTVQRTPLTRILEDLEAFSYPLVTIILTLVITLHLLIIYNYRVYYYQLQPNVPNFFHVAINPKLTITAISIGGLNLLLLYLTWQQNKLRLNLKLFGSLSLVVFSIIVTIFRNQLETKFDELLVFQALYKPYSSFDEDECRRVVGIYATISDRSNNPEIADIAKGFEAGANLCIGNPKESIAGYAELIVKNPQQAHQNYIDSLHWAIYSLGREMPLAEAEAYLQDIRELFPTNELSPIWLGISPRNYWLFKEDVVADELFSASPEDYLKLEVLISKYPNDPYADLARLLIDEDLFIVDHLPNSNVRDWAIYRIGRIAYLKRDFEKASLYFARFLEEFPSHRWADDAAFRLARAHELLGNYEGALLSSLQAATLPDEDMKGLSRLYSVALIDVYFSSVDLQLVIRNIEQSNQVSYLPLLEFSLAEQLFKEWQLVEAQNQFLRVQQTYPGSEEAEFVPKNLILLDYLLTIEATNASDSAIDLARVLIGELPSDQPFPIVIYNDLYNNSRHIALAQIGLNGPDWNYFYEGNDNLQAVQILENFVNSYPDHSRVAEALWLESLAYYNLTFGNAFLPCNLRSQSPFVEMYPPYTGCNQQILDEMARVGEVFLQEHLDSRYTPEVLSIIGISFENFQQPNKAIEYMRMIVELFPDHHLANNALIYIARIYRMQAVREPDNSLKRLFLQQAEATYLRVLADYPDGHVGQEANSELVWVRQQLSSLDG